MFRSVMGVLDQPMSGWRWLMLVLSMLLGACASLPEHYPKASSSAFQDHEGTAIGARLAEDVAQHPGKSGFALIRYGRPAFTARVAFTELAEHTLDVQYYIWEPDDTGRILAERLLRAADRGVRVRLLIDDITVSGRDARLAGMDAHPNIEIRIFNPFARRTFRALDFVIDFNRVNHRMHNKLMVMDNAVAIVGGRNIGNHYFGVGETANFRDLDIAAAGPVVREISNVFDHFWNGDWAVPISALVDRPFTAEDLEQTRILLSDLMEDDHYPHPLDQDVAALNAELDTIFDDLIWAPGVILWDDPQDIVDEGRTKTMLNAMIELVENVQEELLIESAYFVFRDRGLEKLQELENRGVRVRILTNSLASNDVLAAHAGYSKRRRRMVASNIELYELRPDPGPVAKGVILGTSKAALHTKALVFDRRKVFIGSLNLDPRSGDINTEAGLLVDSPELAAQVIAYLDEGVDPHNSYRVFMDDDYELYWVTKSDGTELRYDKDPLSTATQRAISKFITLLPVEDQL